MFPRSETALLGAMLGILSTGCSPVVIEPGHRGLLFDPKKGGLQHEVLAPGAHRVGSGRIDDFDVTYTTRTEPMHVLTSEGLQVEVRISVIHRPIVAELYQLDTEIGPRYYDEVIGPEARSATRATFAKHSYMDLTKNGEAIESEIESELRKRVTGKHVEISGVTFEDVQLPPEVVAAARARLVAAETATKRKIELESDAQRERLEAEHAWEKEKRELEHDVERRRLQREAAGAH